MGESVDGDTHAKSWMVGSPKRSGKNGGDSNKNEASFANC